VLIFLAGVPVRYFLVGLVVSAVWQLGAFGYARIRQKG
jgi:hypothetical protein